MCKKDITYKATKKTVTHNDYRWPVISAFAVPITITTPGTPRQFPEYLHMHWARSSAAYYNSPPLNSTAALHISELSIFILPSFCSQWNKL